MVLRFGGDVEDGEVETMAQFRVHLISPSFCLTPNPLSPPPPLKQSGLIQRGHTYRKGIRGVLSPKKAFL